MSASVENTLSFDELRTSLDALCDHYLDDGGTARDTATVDAPSPPTRNDAPMTDENRNFVFGRLLQKIINFYSKSLFSRSAPTTNNVDNAHGSASNPVTDDVMVDDAHGQAKFVADDLIEYAFTSEDADVLLLLKANERPTDENSENYEMPVQQIIIK
jgi:hypothetical protein